MTLIDRMQTLFRSDGWLNRLTGIGVAGTDREASWAHEADADLDDLTISNLYHYDDIAELICSCYPSEALRPGVQLSDEELAKRWRILGVLGSVEQAATLGRAFGFALLVIGADDGRPASAPIDLSSPRRIEWVKVYTKREVQPCAVYSNPRHPLFSDAAIFRVTSAGAEPFEVHRSRCLVFGGAQTSPEKRIERGGVDLSVLQRPYKIVQSFNAGHAALSALLTDASQGVLRLSGFIEGITQKGGEESYRKRAALLDVTRSYLRTMILDADHGETYERHAIQFAGIPDTIDRLALRLAASIPMPVSRLMGRAPSGLNATGEGDERAFLANAEKYRTRFIEPQIERLLRIEAPHVVATFPPLWTPTAKEEAEREKIEAETDSIRLQDQILTPEEVTAARFGANKGRVILDPSLRAVPREKE